MCQNSRITLNQRMTCNSLSQRAVSFTVIDIGKKENFKTSLDTFGILYLKAWILRVLCFTGLFFRVCHSQSVCFYFICPISSQITCLTQLMYLKNVR